MALMDRCPATTMRYRRGQRQMARLISQNAGNESVDCRVDRQMPDRLLVEFVMSGAQQPEFEICVVGHTHQKRGTVAR